MTPMAAKCRNGVRWTRVAYRFVTEDTAINELSVGFSEMALLMNEKGGENEHRKDDETFFHL